MKVTFKNVENKNIQQCFMKVIKRYESLHQNQVILRQKRVKSATMQAQPVLDAGSFFTQVKRYKITLAEYVRDSDELKVSQLPEQVLEGWFAHELGHLVDYENRSSWQMIVYGLQYLFSEKFRKAAEHRADYIAIEHGFHDDIIATKRFILENDFLEEAYKNKIRKYYLSIEDVEVCVKEKSSIKPEITI